MAAPEYEPFDPLVELAGMWSTEVAEHYLPIPGFNVGKYECLDGNLIMSPYESSTNSYAAYQLQKRLDAPAVATKHRVYGTVNVAFQSTRWIQPDVTVLNQPAAGLVWVPPHYVTMVVEFVSPSSRKRDRIDKPLLCAEAGIPYFMEVEVSAQRKTATVRLLKLGVADYEELASAIAGHLFETSLPFPISFDPKDLLDI
ncbi:Uma2 family endonuclease [Umezawaea sp. Da 62-37]|uniref:Uma2 family endonuclease n=1 Tax=Umezawaea sp. Da 62-37 TaxID=3075927 RepID=UPI0028F6D9E5|nr:Uma2 family endonuclease [Umezawaea sp. Da 62-37]WNV91538.1 Uma2 family endonuclease [Umezawaea sp. Da 62-37]